MPSASRSRVAQFSVSASQLIKSVSSLVLKKRKVTAIVSAFYEKRRLKKSPYYSLRFSTKTPTRKPVL